MLKTFVHLYLYILCASSAYALTVQDVIDTWPELENFKGGRHSFSFHPYVFSVRGEKYRLEHAYYERADGKNIKIEDQASRSCTLGRNASVETVLKEPEIFFQQTEADKQAGITYRFSYRPESYSGQLGLRDTCVDMSEFLNAAGLVRMQPSSYAWHRSNDAEYVRDIGNQHYELRLVYLFGYEGTFKEFGDQYNIWDVEVPEVRRDGVPIHLFLYPRPTVQGCASQYATQRETDLAQSLEKDGVQFMISVRRHEKSNIDD